MKRKVLHIITKSSWGGAQKYVVDIASEMKPNFEQAVCYGSNTFGGGNIFEDKMVDLGVKTFPIPYLAKNISIVKEIRSFFFIYKTIKMFRPDVVHLNSSKMVLLGSVPARLAGVKKIVYTAHGFPFVDTSRNILSKTILKTITWFGFIFCTDIITISQKEETLAKQMTKDSKVHQIYNGISDLEFLPESEARAKITNICNISNPDTVILGSIAELRPNKGLPFLLKALKKIQEQESIHYIHFGTGELEDEIKNLIKGLRLENVVTLAGFNHEATKLIKGFDVFVLPSLQEGTPYVLLEAGLAGHEVVATDVGAVNEIIISEKTGFLCEPSSVDSLEKNILSAIKNLGDSSRGAALEKHIHSLFMKERMVKLTKEVYEQ